MATKRSSSGSAPNHGERRVRYAVVGIGYIAQIAVLPAFRNAAKNSELRALVSDDPVKLRKLARRYKVPLTYSYDQFSECLSGGEIDAVYIALPNDLHSRYAVAAAEAGVHVLCEKPLAVTERECQEMIDAARSKDVRLMTAYRLHFEKANLGAVEMVRSGRLGDPRMFHSLFSMQARAGNIRLGPTDRGGGPLYDLGIYCINAARNLFRAEPEEVFAYAASGSDPRFGKTDEMVTGVLRFPGERLATFTCSFGASNAGWYQVVGTKGVLRVDPAYEYAEALEHRLTVDGKTKEASFPKRDQFAPELLYFSDCILHGKEPEPSGREGLADVRVIRALLRSAESGKPVRLPGFERKRRATAALEMKRPPVARPRLVHARSPSGD